MAVKVLSNTGVSSSLEEEFPAAGDGAGTSSSTHPLFESLQKVGGRGGGRRRRVGWIGAGLVGGGWRWQQLSARVSRGRGIEREVALVGML